MEYALIIIAFNLVIFFHTLRYSICIDDIRHYMAIQRGMLDFSFKDNPIDWIKKRFYGGGTLGRAKPDHAPDSQLDHVVTLFLHTLASLLVFFAFGSSEVSFWAAILYACNPTNTQTSIWLNGRRYLMNVILVLLMVIISRAIPNVWGSIACLPLYFSTGLFHVTAIFSPVLFIGWWAIPVSALLYFAFRERIDREIKIRMARISTKDWKTFTPKRLIVVVKVYGFHFFKMFIPGTTLMNYPTLFWWGVTKKGDDDAYSFNMDFFIGCLAIVSTVALILIMPGQYRSFAVFMALAILQWCAIIPAQHLLADRYTSTAMPFMMFFVAFFIHNPLVLACIAGFYVSRLWMASQMFTDIWHYYRYQLYHAPHITTPRKDIVEYFINPNNKNRDYFTAWFYLREGLQYTPNDFALLHRGAIVAKALGIRKMALEYINKAEGNYYIDQEESQASWCKAFKDQMKVEDMAQVNNGKFQNKKRFKA